MLISSRTTDFIVYLPTELFLFYKCQVLIRLQQDSRNMYKELLTHMNTCNMSQITHVGGEG